MSRKLLFVAAALFFVIGLPAPLWAQSVSLPPDFFHTQVVGSLTRGTAMAFAPDGRLFVAQQDGALRVIDASGALLPTPFLTVSVNASGERGLLGVTFDPDFATNNFVYIYYTRSTAPLRNIVSRFTASGSVAVPGSEVILLELNNLTGATNHNGGALHFGADGKLYIAVGENATTSNSQTLNNLLGKVLRINKDGTIPTDNPFFNQTTGVNRAIWALGLRNPFNFAVQPGTGRIFINDVGAGTWEEINEGIAGANYGWPSTEGPTNNPDFDTPLFAYRHDGAGTSGGCAIIGAAFYNPPTVQFPPGYVGDYFFGDYCRQYIRRYDIATDTAIDFASNVVSDLVDIRVAADGSLYYLARGDSAAEAGVYRITYSSNAEAPVITQDPVDLTVAVGESAAFTCQATGVPTPRIQWQRNGTNIPGAIGGSYTLPGTVVGDDGAAFRCVASNVAGSDTSAEATLTVIDGQRPNPVITTPVAGTLYRAGQTIDFAGTASDPDEGTLPASAFTWEVLLHHDQHTHPHLAPTSGVAGGSFTTDTVSKGSVNIWYRIYLTVTDSTGLSRTVTRDVDPEIITVRVNSEPSGLQIEVEGQPHNTPYIVQEVIGVNWQLEAVTPQTVGSTTHSFQAWSDGGAANHNVAIPEANAVFTAYFLSCPVEPSPSPANAAPRRNYFSALPVVLTWNRISWAQGYEVQVDDQPDFSRPEYSAEVTEDAFSVTIPTLQDCAYNWRVRAKVDDANDVWGPWSSRQPFTLNAP